MFTKENFLIGLKKLFPEYIISEDSNTVSYYDTISVWVDEEALVLEDRKVGFEFSLNALDELISKIPANTLLENYILFSPQYIESAIAVTGHNSMIPIKSAFRKDKDGFKVEQHNYRIEIDFISSTYIVAIICSFALTDNIDRRIKRYLIDLQEIFNLEDFCNSRGLYSVKLHSPKELTFQNAKSMLQSFLFNLTYKNDLALSLIEEFNSIRSIRRKVKREGQTFPYKSYEPELIKYYNQGLSTDLALAQYLAFYHVVEFFFQSVSEEDIFQEIKDYITRPSFSPYSQSDVKGFYKKIRKKYLIQKDNDVWDERTALMLCLKKFVTDINSLKDTILTIDSNAIDYYKNNDVSFTDEGIKINFDAPINDIYTSIQKRVYSVRNAIVHSKEGDKRRYEPFKHDTELAKEIPLIRAIAEEIIINSAKPMELD